MQNKPKKDTERRPVPCLLEVPQLNAQAQLDLGVRQRHCVHEDHVLLGDHIRQMASDRCGVLDARLAWS